MLARPEIDNNQFGKLVCLTMCFQTIHIKPRMNIADKVLGRGLAGLARNNKCQEKGPAACGFVVAHWMGSKFREVCADEGKLSIGHPYITAMGIMLQGLLRSLHTIQPELVADMRRKLSNAGNAGLTQQQRKRW